MSKYHINCTKHTAQLPVKSKKCGNKEKQLTSKPFCDCQQCLCNNCPDILKMFSIRVTENSCDSGSKVANIRCDNSQRTSVPNYNSEEISKLLSIMKDDEYCNCEAVARALRSNQHRNIGLPEWRTAISIHEPEVQKTSNNCKPMERK